MIKSFNQFINESSNKNDDLITACYIYKSISEKTDFNIFIISSINNILLTETNKEYNNKLSIYLDLLIKHKYDLIIEHYDNLFNKYEYSTYNNLWTPQNKYNSILGYLNSSIWYKTFNTSELFFHKFINKNTDLLKELNFKNATDILMEFNASKIKKIFSQFVTNLPNFQISKHFIETIGLNIVEYDLNKFNDLYDENKFEKNGVIDTLYFINQFSTYIASLKYLIDLGILNDN